MATSSQQSAAAKGEAATKLSSNGSSGEGRRRLTNYALVIGVTSLIAFVAWKYNDKFEKIRKPWQASGSGEENPFGEWHDHTVNITILTTAVDTGAVCLDGSPPAYFLDRGSGDGVNNWILFIQGGSYCVDAESCLSRSFGELGSSHRMSRTMSFAGILSSSPLVNPDFHNWNRVYVKYCDGASFFGDVADPVNAAIKFSIRPGKVYYRGRRIWSSIVKDLLSKGMEKAERAFLTGCSAGAVATVLHCDAFRNLLPKSTTVKCMSDGGFIVHVPDIYGEQTVEGFVSKVVSTQNLAASFPKSCTSKRSEALCLFPEYLIPDVETPLFIFNSAYDNWQVSNSLLPFWSDSQGLWDRCRSNVSLCDDAQLKTVHTFRGRFLERLRSVLDDEKDGAFIDSCYLHCQSDDNDFWNGPKVDGKSAATAVGDWYFERRAKNAIDCQFPCNPTCPSKSGFITR